YGLATRRAAMEHYVGLDVSLKQTSICVVNQVGSVVREGVVDSEPEAIAEIDWTGRISKCGDAMLRSYLFEAAGVLLTRVPKWSALKAWGVRLAKRKGSERPQSPSLVLAVISAPHVDRPNRVRLVDEEGCCVGA